MSFVIKRPLVSEKNSSHAEANVYAFEVESGATKADVKAAVEKFFRVKVLTVRTVNCRGRGSAARKARVPHWKKALVKLAAGEKITLFEGA